MSPAIRILLVDDEIALLDIGKIFLERSGKISVETATSAPAALHSLSCGTYDAIVSDYEMPELNGIGFLKHLRSEKNSIPFILFTGRGREEVAIEALNNGATFYLQKGHDVNAQYTELTHKIILAVRQCRAERSVRESQRRVENLVNFLPDPTLAMDMEGRLTMWNRATEEMTGVPACDMIGKGDYAYTIPFFGKKRPLIADLLRKPDNTDLAHYYRMRKVEQNLLIGECQATFPDGRRLDLWEKAALLYDASGNTVGVIESIRDITVRQRLLDERKRDRDLLARKNEELSQRHEQLAATEEELRQTFEEQQQEHLFLQDSERNYRNLIESLPDALVIHNAGKILFANPAALRLFCKETMEEIRQHTLFSFFDNEQGKDIDVQSRLALQGSAPHPRREYHILDPGRSRTIVADAVFSPLRYQDTSATQVLFRDISEQKLLEGQITSQNRELRQYTMDLALANRKLQLMYSITRHDILNQVQVLEGYTTLAKSETPDIVQEYLDRMVGVIGLIHQQISFTRDYQDIGIRAPEWQDVHALVVRSIGQIHSARINVAIHTDGLEILADRLLEKIFFNLIDNSLRHGEHITCISLHYADSGNGLNLVFEDDGIGIPARNKRKIFERGFGKNTGMGLFITQEILAITGITITETGVPGHGVRFEMIVPPGKYRFVPHGGNAGRPPAPVD